MSIQKLHRYILGGVGLFIAIAATYPLAMMRISQHEKFTGQAVKSLNCDGKVTQTPVYWLQNCHNVKSQNSAL